jgi:DNA mismatch endonuclease (patch repair protein)
MKDSETRACLAQTGWKVLTIWECALKGKTRRPLDEVIDGVAGWLMNGTGDMELKGKDNNGTD